MIAVIDNYDSFTYNLVQFLGCLGQQIEVYRNDQITIADLERLAPDRIVISPGPGWPKDAGITMGVIEHFASRIPILGVCLGHQAIGQVFGGKIVLAPEMMHGKSSNIFHEERGIFKNVTNPFKAGRYHSLMVAPESLPETLKITARTDDNVIMAISHKTYPTVGVQFHPESILTEQGMLILENFLYL
ncbi:MAG: aminodeoxychorismate/anthranilate synthase component II [candidate division KSB1 bacterium]|nr:aminodeoxychorismate/anthranilate synthase component II [candidate division KSB1 bacterium]MDZ7336441.1 aminodeoxychorismate/anthranilate synthase component II [candidate division KSB1 bacterium]MDZ7357148.1 aminodeoxychorismate/anthranilate synthase component II [candidate division KSB1 bacterium]MDZ7375550.1 aminodeoxychorismate/anthranilate synthase component II [candidate division KSB1 bacterium]MDZ7400216.1 aminodeoxychorismate/anthranilate synthase component II [candidate division KSB1